MNETFYFYGNPQPGKSRPVFIAGIKYVSIFQASMYTDITYPALFKALKKHNGGPCIIRKNFTVLESWVNTRIERLEAAI
jgi:hypothetical protein